MKKTAVYCDVCNKRFKESVEMQIPRLAVFAGRHLDEAGSSAAEYDSYDICLECLLEFVNRLTGERDGYELVRERFREWIRGKT